MCKKKTSTVSHKVVLCQHKRSKKSIGLIPGPGSVCSFSLCPHGFSSGPPTSSHSQFECEDGGRWSGTKAGRGSVARAQQESSATGILHGRKRWRVMHIQRTIWQGTWKWKACLVVSLANGSLGRGTKWGHFTEPFSNSEDDRVIP